MRLVHRSRALRLLAIVLLILHTGAFTLHWEGSHVDSCSGPGVPAEVAWSASADAPSPATHAHECLVCDLVLGGHGTALTSDGAMVLAPLDAGGDLVRPPARAPTHGTSHRPVPRAPPLA